MDDGGEGGDGLQLGRFGRSAAGGKDRIQARNAGSDLRKKLQYLSMDLRREDADLAWPPVRLARTHADLVTHELGYGRVAAKVARISRDRQLAALIAGRVPALDFCDAWHHSCWCVGSQPSEQGADVA